jgi:enamine deaminase RidA (YjgF/YER057c/UK114 family)
MATFAVVALALAVAFPAWPLQKKEKEEETQTLDLPRELPAAVVGETSRLAFHVTPLSAKGLLSQQIKDALKAVGRLSGNAPILKLRAFVAGTGDMRRVREIVSETYSDRRRPLPALSLLRAGGLPLDGAQVVIEAVSSAKKEVNPGGLIFLSARPATSDSPLDPVAPLTEKALASLRSALKAAGAAPADMLRVTCFLSSLDDYEVSRKMVEAEYPRAALNYVQTERAPQRALAACEGVARLTWNTGSRLHMVKVPEQAADEGQSPAALVTAPRLVLTGTQVAFGFQEADARLAFGRLHKAVEEAGGLPGEIVYAGYYPLSRSIAAQVRKVRQEFVPVERPPAGALIEFEALPSMDAGFAIDMVAIRE